MYSCHFPNFPAASGDNATETSREFPMVCPEICGTVPLEELDSLTLTTPAHRLKAFLWVAGHGVDAPTLPEVEEFLDTKTGLLIESGRPSVVSKRGLATLCCSTIEKAATNRHPTSPWTGSGLLDAMRNVSSYADLKALSVAYRRKMDFFREKSRGLGVWVEKCPEEEEFTVVDATSTSKNGKQTHL